MLLAVSESRDNFVALDVPAWQWIALLVMLVVMLGVDLLRHRDDHAPTSRQALGETLVWIACGLAFGGLVWGFHGSDAFGEYISGYLIEKSLSIDNVFVWAVIFSSMAIPLRFQHRVLFWGIFGALVLRAIFIFLGAALITRFWWLLLVFGGFLIITGLRIIQHREDEGDQETTMGLGLLKRFMPVTNELDGNRFFTRIDGGVRAATPLFAALVVVEATDVIFALDSVPAILAVSNEPFLVFASNAFAILGLRAMYFLLAKAKERFHYLSHGLGAILIFVGIKMAASHWYHLDTYVSLAVIVALLAAAIGFSEYRARKLGLVGLDEHDHTHV